MAVPRRNGFDEDDDDENILFDEDENGIELDGEQDQLEYESEQEDFDATPPHLREMAIAIQEGNTNDFLSGLDNLGQSIDDPLEDGDTPLHLACLYGHLPIVELLIGNGANVEVKDSDGALPLHDASASGCIEITKLLIEAAGDAERVKRMVQTVDSDGESPLHNAARGQHVEVIRILLAAGASPSLPNNQGRKPSELSDPGSEARSILESAASEEASQPPVQGSS